MNYTQARGNTNELFCAAAFSNLGYVCLLPYGGGERYDFIVYDNKNYHRIQCKSSKYTGEAEKSFAFHCKSSNEGLNYRKVLSYDKTQIDYFATFFNGNVYVVPVEECTGNTKTLQLMKDCKGVKDASFAEDYLIENVFPKNKEIENDKVHPYVWMRPVHECIECGAPVTRKNCRCKACAYKRDRALRNIPEVNSEERALLKHRIRNYPILQVAKMMNLTDNGVRARCRRYSLPYRSAVIKGMSDEEWEKV